MFVLIKNFMHLCLLYLNLLLIFMLTEVDYIQGPHKPCQGQGAQQ